MWNRVTMNLDGMTYEELISLNRQIVERLKLFDHMRSQTEMMNYRIGQRVRFTPPGRGELSGTVTRYNTKTVSIVTANGEKWNVSPRLLTTEQESKTINVESLPEIRNRTA